jgi:hypothetical protein
MTTVIGKDYWTWIPPFDQLTHWMYFPEAPPYDTVWNKEADHLEYVYKKPDFDFEVDATDDECAAQGIPHKMKRISKYRTECVNKNCKYWI